MASLNSETPFTDTRPWLWSYSHLHRSGRIRNPHCLLSGLWASALVENILSRSRTGGAPYYCIQDQSRPGVRIAHHDMTAGDTRESSRLGIGQDLRSDWRFDMTAVNDHSTTVSDLVDSLRRAHQLCDTTGHNLPELLRTALGATGRRAGWCRPTGSASSRQLGSRKRKASCCPVRSRPDLANERLSGRCSEAARQHQT